VCVFVQGVLLENNVLGRILFLCSCSTFKKIKFTVFTDEDSGHVCSCFRYVWFDSKIITMRT